ncbi:MAG: hypothetical protein DRJ42_03010 [Deltaproteobacteria bacterium]|nr:MAG: hypothetical protein DRJ42_03010 [Deltaproteobacteria bacterium]
MTSDQIRSALLDPDVEVRRSAVVGLETSALAEAPELVLIALGDVEWRVRKEAARVAACLAERHPLVADLTAAVSQGDNIGLRSAAIEVLGILGPAVGEQLVSALDTVPESGRKFLVTALGEVGGDAVMPALGVASRSDDVNLVSAAIDALVRIGGDAAAILLRERLTSGDSFIHLAALDGLDRIGAPIPYEELAPLLHDRLLRTVAIRALGRTGDVAALPALREALEDRSSHVVSDAMRSIFQVCTDVPDAVEALAGLMGQLPEEGGQVIERLVREGDLATRRGAAIVLLLARISVGLPSVLDLIANEELPAALGLAFQAWGRDAVRPLLEVHQSVVGRGRALALELAAELARGPETDLADDLRTALRSGLEDRELEVRVCAARGLGAFATEDDAGRLVAVAFGSPSLARSASASLRALHQRSPAAVEKALSEVELEGQGGAALTKLVGELLGARGLTRLSAALSADDPPTRRAAIEAFSRLGGLNSGHSIVLALADEDVDVQVAAANALGRLRDADGRPVGVDQLLLALESREPAVQAAAARALAAVCEGRAIEPLRDLLREGPPGAALAAMESLRALADPTLGDLLMEALGNDDEELVKQVLSAIYDAGGGRAAVRLAVALSHPAWDVRRHAVMLLADLGGEEARAALEARALVEEDDLVGETLEAALGRMGN